MSSPPLPPVPTFDVQTTKLSYDTIVKLILNALFESPISEQLASKLTGASALGNLIRLQGFRPDLLIGRLRTQKTVIARLRGESEGALVEFVVDGLNQYFGTHLAGLQARDYGILGPPQDAETQIGRAALTAMFAALEHPAEITPEQGFENMQRVINWSLRSAMEGWLLKNTEDMLAMDDILPHWGELHELVGQALGVGRLLRRVFAPILNTLVVEPATRQLRGAFLSSFYNEHQATRALHAGAIDETTYFEVLKELGWSRERAGVIQLTESEHLSIGDTERGLEVGAITDAEAVQNFKLLGHSPTEANTILRIHQLEKDRAVENEVATTAREMFAKREIDEGEYRSALESAGKKPDEVEGLLGLGRLEQSRPTRNAYARMESALEQGLIDLPRFRTFLELEGYSPDDQFLNEQIALKKRLAYEAAQAKKAAAPSPAEGAALPRAAAEQLHTLGLITDAELEAAYTALKFKGPRVSMLLTLAKKKRDDYLASQAKKEKPPAELQAPRANVENAYVMGVIDQARLEAFLETEKLSPEAIKLVVDDLTPKRKAHEELVAKEAAKAADLAHPPPKKLPQAVAEEAHRFGLMTDSDLRAFYEGERFSSSAIVSLMDVAQKKRAAYVLAQQKHAPPPKEPEPKLTTQEHAYEHDLISEDDLTQHYEDQGYDTEDVQMLLELANVRKEAVQAAAAKKAGTTAAARRAAPPSPPATPGP